MPRRDYSGWGNIAKHRTWGRRPQYEVPYARRKRLKREKAAKMANKSKASIIKQAKIDDDNYGKLKAQKANRKVGGDFWGDVGNFFTHTLPDVATQALPMLLAAL